MIDASSLNWYVAQTHTNAEAKAAVHLERQGFETYLPRYLKTIRHARRVSLVRAPLFPRYIFVRLELERQGWRAINSTSGVTQLVGHGGNPVPVQQCVVDAMRAREGSDGLLRLDQPACQFKRGDAVRVLRGAFEICEAVFEAQTAPDRVAILLDLLGRRVRVRLTPDAIEAA